MYWSTVITSAALGLAAVAALLWLGWWRFPKRQVDRPRLSVRDPKARADIEDNLRKTIGQLIAGFAVLIGAGFAYLQFTQQQQTSQQQFIQQQQASRDLLISNQVAKGFEQLGSKKVVVRLGGIYALEGVMNTSEQYHQPVLEALSAFVRDSTGTDTSDGPPATEIQAALTVIGRRAAIFSWPDFANAHIPKALLKGAKLTGAKLVLRFRNNVPMASGCIIDFVPPGVDDWLAIDVADEGHQAFPEFVFGGDADVAQH